MSGDNFIVSVHALDRFRERFPELVDDEWVCERHKDQEFDPRCAQCRRAAQKNDENDQRTGRLIHEECDNALVAGRASFVPPLELALNDLDRWEAGKGLTVWTPQKERGYVLLESPDGMLVATVLIGRSSEEARRRLYADQRPRKENNDPQDEAA